MRGNRNLWLADEVRRLELPRHGRLKIGVGYPNSYAVAMSSLAFQWVAEITASLEDVSVERFFSDPRLAARTIENDRPLGNLDILAWSCSFELDAVNILQTLDAAGIPRDRTQRTDRSPLVVVGGAVASINPLPLSPAVDVFVLGAAELLWPKMIELAAESDRQTLLESLARMDGVFVPARHLDQTGRPTGRRRRIEKRDAHMADSAMVPASWVVTPHTEYANRALVEMSRGCPEKCRYCWVSYNYGRLRCYPTEGIIARVEELRELTDRIGFVATAVGDHPELAAVLHHCRSKDMNVALSSLRIPAMIPEVLTPLAESGARSVTIAPETGSDRLRHKLNKPIPNSRILEAVETAQQCGISSLKMYFIIGLPDETDEDLVAIAELVTESLEILRGYGRDRGRMGNLHAGFNLLIPKPYTPYSRSPMLDRREARRRLGVVLDRVKGLPNLRIDRPSYRESVWQGCLSRGGVDVFAMISAVADGQPLGQVLRRYAATVDRVALPAVTGEPVWRFITSAPSAARALL
jgi:radical SAM superfamily enzyme YgiQ (UPF0313 family)